MILIMLDIKVINTNMTFMSSIFFHSRCSQVKVARFKFDPLFKAGFGEEYQSKLTINLLGDPMTFDHPIQDGPVMGGKSLGVFGQLDLKGVDVGPTWLKLDQPAAAGTDTLTVAGDVSKWKAGDEIIVTSTRY